MQVRTRSKAALVCAGVLLASLISGCGQSERHPSDEPGAKDHIPTRSAQTIGLVASGGQRDSGNACTDAQVSTNFRSATIDIVAHCVSLAEGKSVGFVVQDWPPKSRRAANVHASSHVLKVAGKGAGAGSCQVDQGILGCTARIRGSVKLKTGIWVKSNEQCATRVSVVEVSSPPCEGGTCGGTVALHRLFRGIPRGC